MAFFLEERDFSFLVENRNPNIGPGSYQRDIRQPFGSKIKSGRKSLEAPRSALNTSFVQGKKPGFNYTTNRDDFYVPKFTPGPGHYRVNQVKKPLFTTKDQFERGTGMAEPGKFYFYIEKNDFKKKVQPFAADKVPRFQDKVTAESGQQEIQLYKKNELFHRFKSREAPVKQTKLKLLQSSKWPRLNTSQPSIKPQHPRDLHSVDEPPAAPSSSNDPRLQGFLKVAKLDAASELNQNGKVQSGSGSEVQPPASSQQILMDLPASFQDLQEQVFIMNEFKQKNSEHAEEEAKDRQTKFSSKFTHFMSEHPDDKYKQTGFPVIWQQSEQSQEPQVYEIENVIQTTDSHDEFSYVPFQTDQQWMPNKIKQKYLEDLDHERSSMGPGKYDPKVSLIKRTTPSFEITRDPLMRNQTISSSAARGQDPKVFVLFKNGNVKYDPACSSSKCHRDRSLARGNTGITVQGEHSPKLAKRRSDAMVGADEESPGGGGLKEQEQLSVEILEKQRKAVARANTLSKQRAVDKRERHAKRKRAEEGQVGPGSYFDPHYQTGFPRRTKPEYLQFFGSSQERFAYSKQEQVEVVGQAREEAEQELFPSTIAYEQRKMKQKQTASFLSNRKDLIFSGNSNPGPGDYKVTEKGSYNQAFVQKNWQTSIGAFNSTLKRFPQASFDITPGPGAYKSKKGI